MGCPADRTRAGCAIEPLLLCTEPAADLRELWFAEPRVLTDAHFWPDWICWAVTAREISGFENTRGQAAEDHDLSVRLGSIRKPPFTDF